MQHKYFPGENRDLSKDLNNNIGIRCFGHRLYADQTLYEYLIEFLLVFISPKIKEKKIISNDIIEHKPNLKFKFHDLKNIDNNLVYYTNPRMGFKRYVFFEKSKNENKFNIDKIAYKDINMIIKSKINTDEIDSNVFNKEEISKTIQDFFYGFSAVLKTRSWFAQSLLPVVPEMIFTESIGNKKTRKILQLDENENWGKIENKFESNRHSFLARGGEVYYLHLLLGLGEDEDIKKDLERLLQKLLKNTPLSKLTNFIQNNWENEKEINNENLIIKNNLKFIPVEYKERGSKSCKELINFLSSDINKFQKIEIFATGLMLQTIRMIYDRTSIKFNKKGLWIIDFCKDQIVKKMSVESYSLFEEDIIKLLHIEQDFRKKDIETEYIPAGKPINDLKEINEAQKNSTKLIRKLGKEMGLIIPPTGPNMRFSLSENLIKFLVLSIVEPGKKMELNTFLKNLFENYGFVIGPNEMKEYCRENKSDFENVAYFDKNKHEFQETLKKSGFLRNLSDATSIVENPYEGV
ncbi:MAG: hypothetical protein B6I28_00345 [Fusobacteriia bacterium 4572_132]|nr:MAG: hypothetical protein B6I28_00345 [Fusobacteriia bacterium 4572_132]